MKRTIKYIPEVEGCYGMRIWVPAEDKELIAFIKPICLWGGHTDSRKTVDGYEVLYELPFGIEESFIWKLAMERLNVELVH